MNKDKFMIYKFTKSLSKGEIKDANRSCSGFPLISVMKKPMTLEKNYG